jgi:proteasome accessory factor B
MLQVHQQLIAGSFPNCRKLADELEVSTKTIQRDIDFMRDQLGLPIRYDQMRFGFYYFEPVASFPSLEVTEGELVALFVGQKALEGYSGTAFERPLRRAFEKLTNSLRESFTFSWHDLETAFSFKIVGSSEEELSAFETVSKAVLHRTELTFEYRKLDSAKFEQRRVQPYHVGCIDNRWYLFGQDLARDQIRTFALCRMRNVRDTKLSFRPPANFSIDTLLGGAFGVFVGSGNHEVHLRFDPFAGRLVSERKWHDSQTLKPRSDGGVDMTLKLGSLEEIERWVLGWGAHVRVLAPASLVKRVASIAREVHAQYEL